MSGEKKLWMHTETLISKVNPDEMSLPCERMGAEPSIIYGTKEELVQHHLDMAKHVATMFDALTSESTVVFREGNIFGIPPTKSDLGNTSNL